MNKKITCKTGMEKGLVSKEVFDREVALCREMSAKDGGCCWGRCETCGVIPLLYKLYKGKLVDDARELIKLRKKFL